ncbi:hypothetical protein [Geminocystis sp. NIES-3709]|uniref:hypothetical protein n=1 Tax=Geminocystis sp. NIES-3709 TaxID=1617448 RepID=UPI00118747CC|nr:hypothetical protein [Geminocystis sp. NIES-3709]
MNLFIYSLSFGGLVNLAISGYLIRRGTLIDESGIFVYFKFFAEGLPWITLLLTSFCINFSSGNMKKSRGFSNTVLTAYILITISLIFSLIFALGTGGRGNLIVTILPCVYLLINKYRRFFSVKQIILVTVTLLLAYWVTIYARPYMYALGSTAINKGSFALNDITALAQGYIEKASGENVESDFKTSIVGFFSNLDHTVTATYLVMSNPEHFNFPRIFLDYFRALISLIPGIHYSTFDLFHVTKNPSMLVNDFLGFGSLVPPGWIANAYVNGWYPLVFLWGFIAGYIGGKIEYTIRINIAIAPWMEGIYIFMYFYWNLIFFHGESTKLVLSNIPFVIIIFTLLQWLTISKRHYKIFKTGNRKVIIA